MLSYPAAIFRSGNSQAVRIPKEFQLEGDEVEIQKHGSTLVLRPKRASWTARTESLKRFTDDFMKEGRKQPPPPKNNIAQQLGLEATMRSRGRLK